MGNHVQPDSNDTVTIFLLPTTDCASQGALCTQGGQRLSAGPAFQVPGPVADGEVPVWSADMLVVQYTSVSIGAASTDLFSNVGGSAGLQVKTLWYYAPDRELYFTIAEPIPGDDDLTLIVGDLALAFPAERSRHTKWENVDVDWEGGQTIAVRIVPTSALVEPTPNTSATGLTTISGTAQVGETLEADTSDIDDQDGLNTATFAYQWLADDVEIVGATSASYTLVEDDEGKAIRVRVSFTDDADNEETLTSAATATVAARPNSPPAGLPTITGTAQVGKKLTASTTGIIDTDGLTTATFSYQWVRNDGNGDTDIGGATGVTYTLQSSDLTKTLKVRVSFTDDVGNEESLTSQPVGPEDHQVSQQQANSPPTGLPTISGTAQVGETLEADTSGIGDADGISHATFIYQWLAGGSDISGAIGSSHTLTSSEQGQTIQVRVSFTDDRSNDETLTSAATATVAARPNSPPTGLPTISGTAQVGEKLEADTSGIGDADGMDTATFSYQWVRNDGSTDADIDGATGANYTQQRDDLTKTIKVRVSFTDDVGNEESLVSQPVGPVDHQVGQQQTNSSSTGALTISGTAQVGKKLTADTSGIVDNNGLTNATFTYQWIADDTDIEGATDLTYELSDADVGKTIKVKVSFTDDANNQETQTSAATATVAGAPADPPPADPLTASLANAATSHNGTDAFTFELRFSEDVRLSYKTLRDHSLTVTGGTVTKAKRLEQGSNIGWRITVVPDGDAAVTIVLPVTTDCNATGAICTRDDSDRPLSNRLEITVSGPDA